MLSNEVKAEVHDGKCKGGTVPAQPAMMYFINAAEKEKQSTLWLKSHKHHTTERIVPSSPDWTSHDTCSKFYFIVF